MPKIMCERIDPRFDGGPVLWRAEVLYDLDLPIAAFGESLSSAVGKLGKRLKGLEVDERFSKVIGKDKGDGDQEGA